MYQSWGTQYNFNDGNYSSHTNPSTFNVSSMRDSIISITADAPLSDVSMSEDLDQYCNNIQSQAHHNHHRYTSSFSGDADMDVVMEVDLDEDPVLENTIDPPLSNANNGNYNNVFDDLLAGLALDNDKEINHDTKPPILPVQAPQPLSWSTKELLFNPTKLGAKLALSNESPNNELPLIDLYTVLSEKESTKEEQVKQNDSENSSKIPVDNLTDMIDSCSSDTGHSSQLLPNSSDEDNTEATTLLNPPIKQALTLPYPTLEWFHSNHDINLPYILSSYLHVLYHFFLIGLLVYIMLMATYTFSLDIKTNLARARLDKLNLNSQCIKNYVRNECGSGTRGDLLEKKCTEWESCISQDPDGISRLGVTAKTITEILNTFFDSMSFKTFLVLLLIGGFIAMVGLNFGFGYLRAKTFLHGNNHGNDPKRLTTNPTERDIS